MELSASYLVDYFSFPRFFQLRLTSHPFCTYLGLKDRKKLLLSPSILLASRRDEIYFGTGGIHWWLKKILSTWFLMSSLARGTEIRVIMLEKLPQHVDHFLAKSRDCWCQSQKVGATFSPKLCFLNPKSFASFWPQSFAGVSPPHFLT